MTFRLTEEQKEAIRQRRLGTKWGPETISKMRAAKLGKKMSAEFKEKMRVISTGRKHTEEARRKISLAKLGKKIGPSPKRMALADAATLRKMFVEDKMFIREMAAHFGVSTGTVIARLREHGIWLDKRSGRQVGERGSGYKGGIKVSRGYKFIAVPEGSPHRRDRDGYVAEHRIVASEMIGRALTREEEVHHLNFDKMDNRPENLMILGDGADHTRFHKYMERVGAYLARLSDKAPGHFRFTKPAFFRGGWVEEVNLTGN